MNPLRNIIITIVFSLISLALLDGLAGMVTGHSYFPNGNTIQNYFGYGFSTERKLKSIIGPVDEQAHPLAVAGWNETIPARQAPIDSACRKNLTFYGMSFSDNVARATANIDPCISIRSIGGPAAPLSHSYAEYIRLNSSDDADVVVVGVLASSLVKLNTVAHFNFAFEAPGTHMYPRYYLQGNELVEHSPPATTLAEFRQLLADHPKILREFLQNNDAFYRPVVFAYSGLDYSVTMRMLRRAYGQMLKRDTEDKYFDRVQLRFNNKDRLLDIANTLLVSLDKLTQANKQKLVVMLINNRGYARSMDDPIGGQLTAHGIRWISSTTVIDSNDRSNFLPDGHFKPELDQDIAKLLLANL